MKSLRILTSVGLLVAALSVVSGTWGADTIAGPSA